MVNLKPPIPDLFRINLNDYRNNQSVDLLLKSHDGEHFKVHKIVLGAASPYFNDLFFGKGTTVQDSYKLPRNLNFLGKVIDYLYTGEIQYDSVFSRQIFDTARFLKLTELEKFCTKNMKIDDENCLEMRRFADKYQIKELRYASDEVIKSNYQKIFIDFINYKDLELDELKSIMNVIDEAANSEVKFEIFEKWLKVDFNSRKLEFNDLISELDCTSMSENFLRRISSDKVLKRNLELMQILLQTALKKKENSESLQCTPNATKCLNILANEGIYKVGLAPHNTITTKFKFDKKLTDFSGASFNNFIYVAEKQSFSVVNLWTGNVQALPRMRCDRWLSNSIELNGQVCCCGGHANGQNLKTVEIFDINCLSWTARPDMNETKGYFGLCAAGNRIYAFGGLDGRQLEYLDPKEGKWGVICKDSTKTFKSFLFKHKSIYCFCKGGSSKLFDLRTNKWGENLPCVGRGFDARSFDVINVNGKFYAIYQSKENWECKFFELDETTMEWKPLDVSHLLVENSSIKFFH